MVLSEKSAGRSSFIRNNLMTGGNPLEREMNSKRTDEFQSLSALQNEDSVPRLIKDADFNSNE